MGTALLGTSQQYVLLQSLEDLHHKTIEWQSHLEFWRQELAFFKKLIKRYGIKIRLRHNIQECKHLRQLLGYYSGDMILSLSHIISQHEHKLKFLLSNGKIQDEQTFRAEHEAMEDQLTAVEKEIKAYKAELFDLIEKVLSKDHKNVIL